MAPPAAPVERARTARMGAQLLAHISGWAAYSAARFAAALPAAAARQLARELGGDGGGGGGGRGEALTRSDGCAFYEGTVWHSRRAPVRNAFSYALRTCVVDLCAPPAWWGRSGQARNHMTADEARAFAGVGGDWGVSLLVTPLSYGYDQNPLAVYYLEPPEDAVVGGGAAHSSSRDAPTNTAQTTEHTRARTDAPLVRIAEVTNNPWGERARFVFDGRGDTVRKCLHVSPLMDMESTWTLRAPAYGDALSVSVVLDHPEYGERFFVATLTARRSARPYTPNERLPLWEYLRYAAAPQRVFAQIYWQAAVLLWKGLPFLDNPPIRAYSGRFKEAMEKRQEDRGGAGMANGSAAAVCPVASTKDGGGRRVAAGLCPRAYEWRAAESYPWCAEADHGLVVRANAP